MSIIGNLKHVGRNLIGALANIGTTNKEVLELDEGIGKAVADHRAAQVGKTASLLAHGDQQAEFKPNRAQRRRRNRFRCSRNVEFHTKRGNALDGNGALKQYASWSHEEANSRGMNMMFNPVAQAVIRETRRQHEAVHGVQAGVQA